ncbi:hypothetical protein BLNAU_7659 [Blattamonas nauphoetae]|uniref:Uncharacterized protein n=1 Tax=Blattamonas nauphoetae TaxID=2049346 RepID=A0ABQ9Y0L9_9EUKA|nr:hypothetical protein BLNAU_7659 [Blattamonas nauphoetae]
MQLTKLPKSEFSEIMFHTPIKPLLCSVGCSWLEAISDTANFVESSSEFIQQFTNQLDLDSSAMSEPSKPNDIDRISFEAQILSDQRKLAMKMSTMFLSAISTHMERSHKESTTKDDDSFPSQSVRAQNITVLACLANQTVMQEKQVPNAEYTWCTDCLVTNFSLIFRNTNYFTPETNKSLLASLRRTDCDETTNHCRLPIAHLPSFFAAFVRKGSDLSMNYVDLLDNAALSVFQRARKEFGYYDEDDEQTVEIQRIAANIKRELDEAEDEQTAGECVVKLIVVFAVGQRDLFSNQAILDSVLEPLTRFGSEAMLLLVGRFFKPAVHVNRHVPIHISPHSLRSGARVWEMAQCLDNQNVSFDATRLLTMMFAMTDCPWNEERKRVNAVLSAILDTLPDVFMSTLSLETEWKAAEGREDESSTPNPYSTLLLAQAALVSSFYDLISHSDSAALILTLWTSIPFRHSIHDLTFSLARPTGPAVMNWGRAPLRYGTFPAVLVGLGRGGSVREAMDRMSDEVVRMIVSDRPRHEQATETEEIKFILSSLSPHIMTEIIFQSLVRTLQTITHTSPPSLAPSAQKKTKHNTTARNQQSHILPRVLELLDRCRTSELVDCLCVVSTNMIKFIVTNIFSPFARQPYWISRASDRLRKQDPLHVSPPLTLDAIVVLVAQTVVCAMEDEPVLNFGPDAFAIVHPRIQSPDRLTRCDRLLGCDAWLGMLKRAFVCVGGMDVVEMRVRTDTVLILEQNGCNRDFRTIPDCHYTLTEAFVEREEDVVGEDEEGGFFDVFS